MWIICSPACCGCMARRVLPLHHLPLLLWIIVLLSANNCCKNLPRLADCRDHSVHASSQWETTLHCNVVSHWLGAYTKWSLWLIQLRVALVYQCHDRPSFVVIPDFGNDTDMLPICTHTSSEHASITRLASEIRCITTQMHFYHDILAYMTHVTYSTSAWQCHYSDVIMGMMASQITSLTIVYTTVYSGADQRKHQSTASLAFVRGIHRWPVNSPHKWSVTWNMFPFDDVIMLSFHISLSSNDATHKTVRHSFICVATWQKYWPHYTNHPTRFREY